MEKETVVIDDDFGMVLNSAVRYALGRMTYLPSSLTRYIIPLLPNLNDRTLMCFIKDINSFHEDVKASQKSWGDEVDKYTWLEFLRLCQIEIERR